MSDLPTPTRAHHPVGAYLPIGQLDGDCSCGRGPWPCEALSPSYARLIEGPSTVQVATAQVLTVLQGHRRVRNTRGCSACTWSPQPVGRNGDPEAMGRRAHQFNAHLAQIIADTLLGASTVRSGHGPGHTPTAADPPPGQREATD